MPFNPDYPVFIGFNGPAGSGKTETAKRIVPVSQSGAYGNIQNSSDEIWRSINPNVPSLLWDHFTLSSPLYEMHNIKTITTGFDAESRISYQLHEILNALLGKKIPYDDLIELVYDIHAFPPYTNGDKPRSFLTGVGDLCRAANNLCFTDYVKHKIESKWKELQLDYDRMNEDPPLYVVIVSDIRMPWEAEMIYNQPNHLLFKFEASEETLNNRLLDRDGHTMTAVQKKHSTETSALDIPTEWFDLVLDTDGLELAEQAKIVYNRIAQAISTSKEEVH